MYVVRSGSRPPFLQTSQSNTLYYSITYQPQNLAQTYKAVLRLHPAELQIIHPQMIVLPLRKLGNTKESYSNYNNTKEYVIIDVDLQNLALSQTFLCSNCRSLRMEIRVDNNVGLTSNLEIFCNYYKYSHVFCTSERLKTKPQVFDINVRIVYGLRAVAKGCEAAKTLCGLLNLPSPPKRFHC